MKTNLVPDNSYKHTHICEELHDIYVKKNSDYGDSFSNTFHKLGVISAVTRISDKCERLITLSKTKDHIGKVNDESMRDTLLDLANYCIMTIMELDGEKVEGVL